MLVIGNSSSQPGSPPLAQPKMPACINPNYVRLLHPVTLALALALRVPDTGSPLLSSA